MNILNSEHVCNISLNIMYNVVSSVKTIHVCISGLPYRVVHIFYATCFCFRFYFYYFVYNEQYKVSYSWSYFATEMVCYMYIVKTIQYSIIINTKIVFFLNDYCVWCSRCFCVVLCVFLYTDNFFMVPLNLTCLHCLHHSWTSLQYILKCEFIYDKTCSIEWVFTVHTYPDRINIKVHWIYTSIYQYLKYIVGACSYNVFRFNIKIFYVIYCRNELVYK